MNSAPDCIARRTASRHARRGGVAPAVRPAASRRDGGRKAAGPPSANHAQERASTPLSPPGAWIVPAGSSRGPAPATGRAAARRDALRHPASLAAAFAGRGGGSKSGRARPLRAPPRHVPHVSLLNSASRTRPAACDTSRFLARRSRSSATLRHTRHVLLLEGTPRRSRATRHVSSSRLPRPSVRQVRHVSLLENTRPPAYRARHVSLLGGGVPVTRRRRFVSKSTGARGLCVPVVLRGRRVRPASARSSRSRKISLLVGPPMYD